MREIKFRAWDKDRKEMCYDLDIHIDKSGLGATHASYGDRGWYLDNFILMQYTGLKDKNGKEIYEGDIVKWWQSAEWDEQIPVEREGKIKWETYKWVIYQMSTPDVHDLVDWGNENDIGLEIIGNIYENPELLKKKKEKI